jgi:hypothetical protein
MNENDPTSSSIVEGYVVLPPVRSLKQCSAMIDVEQEGRLILPASEELRHVICGMRGGGNLKLG